MSKKEVGKDEEDEPTGRHLIHTLVGLAFGVLFIVLLRIPPESYLPFIAIVLIGSQIPDLDERVGLGHRNIILHSALLPLLLAVVLPRHVFVTAFWVGYTSHMVEDLDNPRQRWRFFSEGVGKVVLVASILILLSLIFGVNVGEALRAMGY
jgi:hypothetical protein